MPKTKAYSYIRFSSPQQAEGDSLRRQTDEARRYAERHDLELDTSLTFRDLGVSAAKGANFTGALGQFTQAVDEGRVTKGSYLLIERLDRFSRDEVRTARDRFEALLDKGINIATLSPEHVYRADNYDLTDMIITLVEMAGARSFVENLSNRVGQAWANKRKNAIENGHKLTAICPAWLKLEDEKFQVIPERAAIVGRIFDLTLAGHGKASIARQLNTEGAPTFRPHHGRDAMGWHPSYIRKILHNVAVIGHYQPYKRARKFEKERVPDGPVIENYFPAVVGEDVFYSVQHMKPGASGKGAALFKNMLSGLAVCAKCGGKMHYVSKGQYNYLACDNARRKRTCDAKNVPYQKVQEAVFGAIDGTALDPYHLMIKKASKQTDIARKIEGVAGRIKENEKSINNLLDTLQRVPSAAIEQRLAKLEAEKKEREKMLQAYKAQLADAKNGGDPVEYAQEAINDFWKATLDPKRSPAHFAEYSVKVNAVLKKLIDKIEVNGEKAVIHLRGGKHVISEQLPAETFLQRAKNDPEIKKMLEEGKKQ